MEETNKDDAAARAYAAISAQLEEWTSPQVGKLTSLSSPSSSFLDRALDDTDDDEVDEEVMNWVDEGSSSLTPQKRASAGTTTPIISNAAKKQQRELSPLALAADDAGDDDQIMHGIDPVGVQSPWIPRVSPGVRTASADDHFEYRRYHDALLTYLVARRNLSERLRIQEEEAQLAVVDPQGIQTLEKEETRVELDFLGALSSACLDMVDQRSVREGNLWSLLATLRSLGMSSLLYADDPVHQAHYQSEMDRAISELAMSTDKSPAEVLDDLSERGPLLVSRRKVVCDWMEQCQELLLPQLTMPSKTQTVMWPASFERMKQGSRVLHSTKIDSLHPDAPFLVREASQPTFSVTPSEPLYGKDEEEDVTLLKACLHLILAGHLDRALELCRRCGQPWRAAAWSGGTPLGVRSVPNHEAQVMDRVEEGNPHRPLWKRTCWTLSGKLSSAMAPTGSAVQYEAAMYALLGNDTNSALANPVLCTWEQRMQVVFSAMKGRIEDDLLYRHNCNRRKTGKRFPFPGSEHEREEREQLQCTASLANLSEARVFQTVASYSISEADDPLRSAQAAFIIGKAAVSSYLAEEGSRLEAANLHQLRFLTHLTLFLDSLSASTTSATVDRLEPVKNAVLLKYVHFLATRSDFWRMLALYASLLPTETLVECYPDILHRVEGETDRKGMLKDARELFPPGLDLVILKQVVAMHLSDNSGPRPEIRKMKAVLWLCHYEEHMGDALICANTLLRQFLLEESMTKSALLFLRKYFPDSVVENVIQQSRDAPEETDNDGEDQTMIDVNSTVAFRNALAEHGALECYVEAYNAFTEWHSVIENTSYCAADDEKHSFNNLTETEKEIARSMQRRDIVHRKNQTGQAVMRAADVAKEKLLQVLCYPGGFLCQDDGNAEDQRCDELVALRRSCLPRVVFWLHDVCDGTATWMEQFLRDGIPRLGKSRMDVLSALDNVKEPDSSPLTPTYWVQHCLKLAETVASDEFEIYQAFQTKDTKKFLALMAEAAVRKLQYTSNENRTHDNVELSGTTQQSVIEIDEEL